MDGQHCDCCIAPAHVKIDLLRVQGTLYFCHHHADKHFPLVRTAKIPSDPYPGMLFTLETIPK